MVQARITKSYSVGSLEDSGQLLFSLVDPEVWNRRGRGGHSPFQKIF